MLKRSALAWLWISVVVIALDRWTKLLVLKHLTYGETVPVFPGFNLVLYHNTGAAFSFLAKSSWATWLFTAIAIGVSSAVLVWMGRLSRRQWWQAIALALIVGGALGNLWDRLSYGYVVDFIEWYVKDWYWPAFNIADSAIVVGAAMLVLWLFAAPKSTNPVNGK